MFPVRLFCGPTAAGAGRNFVVAWRASHDATRNLKNMDMLSKSDPQIQIFLEDSATGAFNEIGRTEMIR